MSLLHTSSPSSRDRQRRKFNDFLYNTKTGFAVLLGFVIAAMALMAITIFTILLTAGAMNEPAKTNATSSDVVHQKGVR